MYHRGRSLKLCLNICRYAVGIFSHDEDDISVDFFRHGRFCDLVLILKIHVEIALLQRLIIAEIFKHRILLAVGQA